VPEPADAGAALDAEPKAKARRGGNAAVVLAVASAVFAVLTVLFLLLYLNARKDHDTLADELRIRTTASRFSEAFVALDSTNELPEQNAVVAELGTGPIIGQHTEAMASLRKAYQAFGAISARADIKGTYLSQIDDSSHEATVIVNLTLTVAGTTQTVPNESYLEVHLVKLNGTWKVDNVVDVRGRLGAQPATSGTSTTTTATTAPGTAPETTAEPTPSSSSG
jgi:hypothetical protein